MNGETTYKPYQLAKDYETYGDNAGNWILVFADSEEEVQGVVFSSEDACGNFADLLNAAIKVIDSWEGGDLAKAVNELAAALDATTEAK
jgi:hypothetical protein